MRGRRIGAAVGVTGVLLGTAIGAIPANASQATGMKAPTWRQVASPNPKGTTGNSLDGVTCANPKVCVAVGSTSHGVLVATHKHHGWVRVAAKLAGGDASLDAVDCATAASCLAVGYAHDHVAAIRYDGKRWSTESPSKPQSDLTSLNAVSCPSTSQCWTVGQDDSKAYGYVPIAEHYSDGAWKQVPVKLAGQGGVLSSVDCVSDRNCWGVGQSWKPKGTAIRTLIEHWDGSKWQRVASPKLGHMSGLAAVSCVSETDCYAAGNVSHFPASIVGQPFVEHYNGHRWTFDVKWKHYDQGARISGISCAAAGRCAVVGAEVADGSGNDLNFILELDKQGWHQATVAQPDTQPELNAVACPTTNGCYAVGSYSPGGHATNASLIVQRK